MIFIKIFQVMVIGDKGIKCINKIKFYLLEEQLLIVSFIIDSNIYILGGGYRTVWTPELVYESCLVFDIDAYVTEQFRETSAMLFGREKSACSVFGGRIVVSGGEIGDIMNS